MSNQVPAGDYRSTTSLAVARTNLRRRFHAQVTVTGPPEHVRLDRDVEVTTRDGTVLRVNVFRPEAEGRYPVLLSAQPYGKDQLPSRTGSGRAVPLQYRAAANDAPMRFSRWTSLEAPDPAFWVPRGYVIVNADLRGWGHSAGQPEVFGPHEGDDVHDVIEWAAQQPWSNTRIGMTGVSYLAISQWAAAATKPPHLAAINPWEGFTDAYSDFAYPGGVRENGFIRVWSFLQRLMRPRSPSFRGGQKRHPLRDDWWAARTPQLTGIAVPALICASYSDHNLHSRGSFAGFHQIASAEKWLFTHRAPKWSTYYGEESKQLQAKFFDHYLRGDDTGMTRLPRVRVEVRTSRTQVAAIRTANHWPPEEVIPTVLHLDAADARLHAQPRPGIASIEVPRVGVSFRYRFDTNTDVVGPMRLRLPVRTTRTDLTLFAAVHKFHDNREVVFEGSYGFTEDVVTRGWLNAGHRATDPSRSSTWEAFHRHTSHQPLRPGETTLLDLTLLPSATRFAEGDELVLQLTDRSPLPANQLTGQFPAIYQHSRRQRWEISTGATEPATLTIPVWPRKR